MYSARLSLGCGSSPRSRNRRRWVSLVIHARTREAARVFGGKRPSNAHTGQIAQNSLSAGSEKIGTPGSPQAGQRCSSTVGTTGRRVGAATPSLGKALVLYTADS